MAINKKPVNKAPPELAAAEIVMNAETGQILHAKNADVQGDPASLTKLMTAYAVMDAIESGRINLDQKIRISAGAAALDNNTLKVERTNPDGSKEMVGTLPEGSQMTIREALTVMMTCSANGVAKALGEVAAPPKLNSRGKLVPGTERDFAREMTRIAHDRLEMHNSSFINASGLNDGGPQQKSNLSTARDMAVLSHRLMKDFPEFVPYYAIQRYRYPGTPKSNDTNRNTLLFRDPTVDGLKTGHTNAAGYCLVATAHRPVAGLGEGPAGQRRLVSVLLGASSENVRAAESQKLLNWGYTAYEAVRLVKAGQPVAELPVWKGKEPKVKLGLPDGVVVSVPAGQGAQLKTEVQRPDPLVAPLQVGQALGVLKVSRADGSLVAEVPLQVLETVAEAGILGRAWDAIRLWVK